MICAHCNVENNTGRKYCRSCGSPMGTICDRCGVVNEPEDKFCGVCGFPFIHSRKQEADSPVAGGVTLPVGPGQYTQRDIEELMAPRMKLQKVEGSAKSLSQDEINKLFG